jgi:hypothetical protein
MYLSQVKLTPRQFEYGINLGLQPCERENLEFHTTAQRDNYLSMFVNRAKEWNATHDKKDILARGTILQFLKANGIILDSDSNAATGVGMKEAYRALEKLTQTRFYVLESLVLPAFLQSLQCCHLALPVLTLACLQVFDCECDPTEVIHWDEDMAELECLEQCLKINISPPVQLLNKYEKKVTSLSFLHMSSRVRHRYA